ncbi:hypothetical protein FGO68_gene467 [Halteria grandinella]|uniref:Uncharacterized protein n=1 Tax=Halteria grandinella TaxID=5974 RepID=A0A8J8P2K9_HALGN|nr:hypothetical protein FGO68_gene467 [Halteria grandinella]
MGSNIFPVGALQGARINRYFTPQKEFYLFCYLIFYQILREYTPQIMSLALHTFLINEGIQYYQRRDLHLVQYVSRFHLKASVLTMPFLQIPLIFIDLMHPLGYQRHRTPLICGCQVRQGSSLLYRNLSFPRLSLLRNRAPQFQVLMGVSLA